jgi:two-component system response regulator NreC
MATALMPATATTRLGLPTDAPGRVKNMTSTAKIRVLLADDHTLVRQGLRAILEREADIKVIGEATNGKEVLRKAIALRPDIILMDISMPRLNGIEATSRIREEAPLARVVILSMHSGEDYVRATLRAGASGYVLKDAPASDLLAAIRAAREGGFYLHPRVSGAVVNGYLEGRKVEPAVELTAREREILQLIAEGMTNRGIAEHLGRSVKTIEAHRTRVMAKLNLHNTADLVRFAISRGLASSE